MDETVFMHGKGEMAGARILLPYHVKPITLWLPVLLSPLQVCLFDNSLANSKLYFLPFFSLRFFYMLWAGFKSVWLIVNGAATSQLAHSVLSGNIFYIDLPFFCITLSGWFIQRQERTWLFRTRDCREEFMICGNLWVRKARIYTFAYTRC